MYLVVKILINMFYVYFNMIYPTYFTGIMNWKFCHGKMENKLSF